MSVSSSPRPAAGTRSFWFLLSHPRELLRAPSAQQGLVDQEAVLAGETRTVSCFLRADFGEYPRRPRQGLLQLQKSAATWRPFWSIRRRALRLPTAVAVTGVREPGRPEWNVKSDQFRLLVCRTSTGVLELAVPTADVPLVEAFLSGS